jgi:rhomboid protease GluP
LALPYQWQMRVTRWKQIFGGMFGGGGEKRPKLCPACGALVGINATRCHECGTSTQFSLAALSKGLSEFFGGHAPVTVVLLIVNAVMFGLSIVGSFRSGQGNGFSLLWSMDGITLYRLGSSNPFGFFVEHQWWRIITASFLHGGLLHIGMNMLVLLDIGPILEELYGSARYLFVYVVTGAAGFALSVSMHHNAVGASAALMGLIGAMIAITTKRSGMAMQAMRSRLISWVVSVFAIGFLMGGIVDNWGHAGGLAGGFLLGKILADRPPMNARERTSAYVLGWIAAGVTVVSFVLMFMQYGDPLPGTR